MCVQRQEDLCEPGPLSELQVSQRFTEKQSGGGGRKTEMVSVLTNLIVESGQTLKEYLHTYSREWVLWKPMTVVWDSSNPTLLAKIMSTTHLWKKQLASFLILTSYMHTLLPAPFYKSTAWWLATSRNDSLLSYSLCSSDYFDSRSYFFFVLHSPAEKTVTVLCFWRSYCWSCHSWAPTNEPGWGDTTVKKTDKTFTVREFTSSWAVGH